MKIRKTVVPEAIQEGRKGRQDLLQVNWLWSGCVAGV
jgi:hypothetical protein